MILPLLFIAALILIACGPSDSPQTNSTENGDGGDVQVGDTVSGGEDENLAPNFLITMFQGADVVGGEQIYMASLFGHPVVLNFWAGLCPPCRAEMPDLQEFYDENQDRVLLLGIDIGQFIGLGSQQDATDLLEELNVTYPAGFTNDRGVVADYRVFGMPSTVFIDADGKIFKQWTGALNKAVLVEQVDAMLAQ